MLTLAVLISNAGTGTNLQAIIDAIENTTLHAKIAVVISGDINAYGLERAKKHNIPSLVIDKKVDIKHILQMQYKVDMIILAGWKRMIPEALITAFKNKIINLHPGLIPNAIDAAVYNPDGTEGLWNRGKLTEKAIQNFLEKKATHAGSTLHFLSDQFDFGVILGRCFEKIKKNDTVETLYVRLKKKENAMYVGALIQLSKSQSMDILIIGSGGREHALGWKLKQSPQVKKLFFAPGNGGTAQLGENVPIQATEIKKLLSFAQQNNIDFTLVGPEGPLSLGIVDLFEKKRLAIFGPTKRAALLESSKTWATRFMQKYTIPHPVSYTFKTYKKALSFVTSHDMNRYVIKASGLALGKGVILPASEREARETIERIMVKHEFGDAGRELLIQERLIGQEVSLMAISDGKTILQLLPVQDHKRIYNDDKGPNTGGMGAYVPLPFITEKLLQHIQEKILQPTIDGMKSEKIPYKGVLYAGLIITKEGPKVLEYNCRFGDPETQPLMMLLQSDLLSLLLSSREGTLNFSEIKFYKQSAVCVVLAAGGYPGVYTKEIPILGLSKKYKDDVYIFHAGTKARGRAIVTNGGRVLGVVSMGKDIKSALQKAYYSIGKKGVHFKGMQYRTDIGRGAITNRGKKTS